MKKENTFYKLYDRLILESIRILSESQLDQLKATFVGEGELDKPIKIGGKKEKGKKMSEDVWNKISNLTISRANKDNTKLKDLPQYFIWLLKMVAAEKLPKEDIDQFGDSSFGKGLISRFVNKKIAKYLKQRDITKYSNVEDLRTDVADAEDQLPYEYEQGENLVPQEGIDELKQVGIDLIGTVAGYQCFKVPQGNDSEETFKVYTKYLAKCASGDITLDICTMRNYGSFKKYIQNEDYYIFFNTNDKKAPYQFGYGSQQFHDVGNRSVLDADYK